jgi:hypothetical protein
MTVRLLTLLAILTAVIGLSGCETTEKPSDSMLPQSQPASWQGGLPGMSTPGSGYR